MAMSEPRHLLDIEDEAELALEQFRAGWLREQELLDFVEHCDLDQENDRWKANDEDLQEM